MKQLVCICLSLCLTGCGMFSRTVSVYSCPVPVSLIKPTTVVYPEINTTEDLVVVVQDQAQALGQCNVDKQVIWEIVKGVNNHVNP